MMLTGIVHVNPTSKHSNRPPASPQCRGVRLRVDAARQAADHGEAETRQSFTQARRHLAAVRARRARAYHGDGKGVLRADVTFGEKEKRRIVNVAQWLRIAFVLEGDQTRAAAVEPLQLPFHLRPALEAANRSE